MFINIRDRSFIYLLLLPSTAVILGAISFYLVEQRADEPSVKNMEDAFWLTITTMSTVGYGEIYPATTEGRIVATILLFAGILTFFGFLSTIASKIIKPTLEVKSKDKPEGERKRGERREKEMSKEKMKGDSGSNRRKYINKYDTKELLKDRIDNLERLNRDEFANLLLRLTEYYRNNSLYTSD